MVHVVLLCSLGHGSVYGDDGSELAVHCESRPACKPRSVERINHHHPETYVAAAQRGSFNRVVLGRLMGLIRSVAVSALLNPSRSSMSIRAWKPRATVSGILYRRSMLSAPLLASAVCVQCKARGRRSARPFEVHALPVRVCVCVCEVHLSGKRMSRAHDGRSARQAPTRHCLRGLGNLSCPVGSTWHR